MNAFQIGIEPEAFQEDEVTPQGIGIKVGHAIVVAHADDGVNLIGDKSGKKYKKVPYSDYTGYKPVNTAFELNHPSRYENSLLLRNEIHHMLVVNESKCGNFKTLLTQFSLANFTNKAVERMSEDRNKDLQYFW